MNMMNKSHVRAGRIIYKIVFPLRRMYRSKRTRAYGVIEHSGKILVVKNWLGSGTWSLPGGGAKRGEQHEETLKRELHEEIGINIDVSKASVLIKGEHRREFGVKKFIIFHLSYKEKPATIINHLELTDFMWVDKKELKNIEPKSYELQKVIEKI
jgi:8-oxo-dGTP pyrophosphatase MutT (NUDIX family)